MSVDGAGQVNKPRSEAFEAYLAWLDRLEQEEDADFEGFCAEYPALADELRQLHGDWCFVESLLERLGVPPSSSGDRSSGGVEDPAAGELEREILERLTRRAGAYQRYSLRDVIARGGMGTVRRVWDSELRRSLAMKVQDSVGDEAVDSSTRARRIARFLEEAQIAAQLDHPGIAPVHELGVDDRGQVYFTMKLVDGRTLLEIIDEVHAGAGEWTRERALGAVLRVAEAVGYAHAKGVIHRDLKPANVMVGRHGEVYVMDWGLARILDRAEEGGRLERASVASDRRDFLRTESSSSLTTLDGDVVGTPAYMSPEQAQGKVEEVGERSDVYAAGALLYHLLTGGPPYADVRRGADVLARVREGPPPGLDQLARDVPPELASICEKAMARQPAERYASMAEFADDLRAFLEGRVVRAFRTGPVAELQKWVTRNRLLAAAVLVALAGTIVSTAIHSKNVATETIVSRLSALKALRGLEARADELWPARPALIQDCRDWLQDAEELRALLGDGPDGRGWRSQLEGLREQALPVSPEEQETERRGHPDHWKLSDVEQHLAVLRDAQRVRAGLEQPAPATLRPEWEGRPAEELLALAWPLVHRTRPTYGREAEGWALAEHALEETTDPAQRAEAEHTKAWALLALGLDAEAFAASERSVELSRRSRYRDLRDHLADRLKRDSSYFDEQIARREDEADVLRERIAGARVYTFEDPTDQTLHDQIAELVTGVDALFEPERGLVEGLSPQSGRGVRWRLRFASAVTWLTLTSPLARERWSRAVAEIEASPAYRGLRVRPQLGLLPLGADPDSGLQEFAHLESGRAPQRDEQGRLVLDGETGVVLVLLPGGPSRRGAQRQDPDGANYDEHNRSGEGPVHAVVLEPRFVAKTELTQGQWLRLAGDEPSRFTPEYFRGGRKKNLARPVEEVSWFECERVLRRAGLELPTEAQWEYAARGGSETAWSSGGELESLFGAANLLDGSAHEEESEPGQRPVPWQDGYRRHAPVASFAPNAFGLHDVHGNVREWCFDAYQSEYRRWALAAHEPVVDPSESRWRALLYRIVRGGGFRSAAVSSRSAARGMESPEYRSADLGVRPVRALAP